MSNSSRPSLSTSSLGDPRPPRSSVSSLSLNAWPIPPLQQSRSKSRHSPPSIGLALEMDTMPFSEFFADDFLDDTAAKTVPERILSPKKSDISIKTYVLEDSIVSQIIESITPVSTSEDRWLSRRKTILPTIAEQDDPPEKCSDTIHSIEESDQPFEVDFDNCLLTSIIRTGTPLPETTLLYAAQLVASISSLHAAGVVHGLISPETVAIRNEKCLVLCDCERRTLSLRGSPTLRDHEHQRMYLYNAPEIVLGWARGSAVDSWGFGIVLYYMLIGFHPFGDRDGQEDRIVNAKSHALRYLDLVDTDARNLVSKCLERNPALRPSISEIKAHPYFAAIDWSKMITRYVRVPFSEEPQVNPLPLGRPHSTLFTPTETSSKTPIDLQLGIPDLRPTFDGDMMSHGPLEQPLQAIVNDSAPITDSTAKSEWFASTADVLEITSDPKSIPTEDQDAMTTTVEPDLQKGTTPQPEEAIPRNGCCHDSRDLRMKLFWDMVDSEQDPQGTSIPANELPNTLTYFTSRPRRLRSRQSSAMPFASQLSLWRSSLDVSSSRLNEQGGQSNKNKWINESIPQAAELQSVTRDLPPGIERIGNGIGYTYALPAASRSKLSICSNVPRSCHGIFGCSPKFSIGLGLGIRKAKIKYTDNVGNAPKNSIGFSTVEISPESSPEWNMTPFYDDCTTTVVYASSRPTLTNAVPTSCLDSPRQESEAEDSDEAGPLTPDTVALDNGQEKDRLGEQQEAFQDIMETPTLRLVSVCRAD